MNDLWRNWSADYTIGVLLIVCVTMVLLAIIIAVTAVELRKQR